jgi:hypothetical protein
MGMRRIAGVAFLLVLHGCTEMDGGQSGDEGTAANQSGVGVNVEPPFCRREWWYGPTGPHASYLCKSMDERYRNGELSWTGRAPTPEGPYQCSCAGVTAVVADANSCDDAIATACSIDLNAPQSCTPDEAQGGSCWPVLGKSNSWQCQCTNDGPLTAIEEQSCEGAWARGCSPSCEDTTGSCDALSSGAPGIGCQCSDGSRADWPGIFVCTDLLRASCVPECVGTRGTCFRRLDGFECGCTSPQGLSAPSLIGHDRAYGDCNLALEVACGVPPQGETCHDEELGGTSCSADGQGSWTCDCKDDTSECPPTSVIVKEGRVSWLPVDQQPPTPPPGLLERPRTCVEAARAMCASCK